ncbi:Gfo/Idh/MocA family protein [Paenibacillus sp. Aloe-11]|uniref:Gfo/Idh/MocA family protein n=1 Tax=Paenibacillus sp. Aloe-11 TaxID=1050222 RepID=UPI0002ECE0E9|nr:Gfo/Idh/MocA family oxidoreductase [Paenibacillus sp. Aloe-11]
MMNIGILGTGFGAYHATLLNNHPKVNRIVVFGRNETKLQKLREDLNVEVTQNIEDILLDSDMDVVDLCLPSHLHRSYAMDALKHGKHVFCETPVCFDLEDSLLMQQAEKQYGKKILVNQFIKFDPAYTYLYEAHRQQKYGKLVSLSLKRETPPLWGDLGPSSIPAQFMIHELDLLAWLLGPCDPCTVWGTEVAHPEQAQVRAYFQHQNTFTEVIASSHMPTSYPFTVAYEAYFEKAKLVYHESDENDLVPTALYEYTASGQQKINLESANPYEKSLDHALACFNGLSECLIPLEQAIQSLEMAIKIKHRLGKF